MRRVLSDSSNQGNVSPATSRRNSGDENDSSGSDKSPKQTAHAKTPAIRLSENEVPAHFEFSQAHLSSMAEHFTPAKSSPLKRVDGRINLDQPNFGTPAKRRSLHGASMGPDFDIFSQSTMAQLDMEAPPRSHDQEHLDSPFATPAMRRSTSLRKSTNQRQTPMVPRQRTSLDHPPESTTPLPTTQKGRQRMSLDSSFLIGPQQESPFVKPAMRPPPPSVHFGQRTHFPRLPVQHPHPLSNAVTASSSGSSVTDNSPVHQFQGAPFAPRSSRYQHNFAKSLPLGVGRPTESFYSESSSQGSFETPDLYKFARPDPNAFMSTGVISKRNRNLDTDTSTEPVYQMPDTPSKRASFPPVTGSPFNGSAIKKIGRTKLDFGVLPSPFVGNANTPHMFPKSELMFPPISSHVVHRKSSFVSVEGDQSQSPHGPPDSQSSADELPPTPTKPAGKKEKESSLRSSLFGRRVSLNPETFVPPGSSGAVDVPHDDSNRSKFNLLSSSMEEDEDEPAANSSQDSNKTVAPVSFIVNPAASPKSATRHRKKSSAALRGRKQIVFQQPYFMSDADYDRFLTASPNGKDGRISPHTPIDSFTPPDASGLSISAGQGRWGVVPSLNSSTMSNTSFPPATPTAQRDYVFPFANSAIPNVHGLTHNDVDTSLAARFNVVNLYGNGEFSQVFRVEGRIDNPLAPSQPSKRSGVWAVKKAKKPFTGPRDRERRFQEV